MLATKEIELDRLVEADWNPNRVPPAMLRKIRRSLEEFGVVENLVARRHPRPGLTVAAVPGEKRHRNRAHRGELELVRRVARRERAAELHSPLPVVVNRLRAYPRPRQGIEALDSAREARHGPALTCGPEAGPAPLIHRLRGRAHQEIRPLHARGDGHRELHGELVG